MSKLALMYACADCFQCMSKKEEAKKPEEVELRTHTGIGRTRSLWGKEEDNHGKNGRDSGKPNLQDRSVHGLELHHAEDHGNFILPRPSRLRPMFIALALSPAWACFFCSQLAAT